MATYDEIRKVARRWKGVDPVRSRTMSLVRGKNTQPEIVVRRLVHKLGYRYSLHHKGLPGKPDLVLHRYRKIIFVHGCYWHAHVSVACRGFKPPKTRRRFWTEKISKNVQRDRVTQRILKKNGWDILIVWECQTAKKQQSKLQRKLAKFLADKENIP